MAKHAAEWTDARLDDLAALVAPVPAQIAVLGGSVERLDHVTSELEPVPSQVAVLTAAVERLTDENRVLRTELSATQRQLVQIAWGLVAALVGAAAALMAAVI